MKLRYVALNLVLSIIIGCSNGDRDDDIPVGPTKLNPPQISTNTSLDFGSVDVGNKSNKNLVVSNEGEKVLDVNKIELLGSTDFSLSQSTFSISGGEQKSIVVEFAPQHSGFYTKLESSFTPMIRIRILAV